MSSKRDIWSIYKKDGTMAPRTLQTDDTAARIKLPGMPAYDWKVEKLWSSALQQPTSATSLEVPSIQDIRDPVQLAETCVVRAKRYLRNKDPMQASEKLYKAAEETIKFLAEQNNISEFKSARKQGMWSTGLLHSAPPKLSVMLGKKEIAEGWTFAFQLHVQGFHENKLGVDEVKYALPYVEKLVKYAQEVSDARREDS